MDHHHFFICKNDGCDAVVEPETDPNPESVGYLPVRCPECGRLYEADQIAELVGEAYLKILHRPAGHYRLIWMQIFLGIGMTLAIGGLFYLLSLISA